MGRELWGSRSIGEHTERQLEAMKSKRKVRPDRGAGNKTTATGLIKTVGGGGGGVGDVLLMTDSSSRL